eukprot:10829-Heterococcus_DN1.PRE.1
MHACVITAVKLQQQIVQHDYPMMRPFDCLAAVRAMQSPEGQHIKYAGLLSSSTLSNKDRVELWFKKSTRPDTISMSGFRFRPLYFWYDKPHIADVDFYLKTVFSGQQAVLKGRRLLCFFVGAYCVVCNTCVEKWLSLGCFVQHACTIHCSPAFIEDTFGHAMLADCKEHGKDAHIKYRAYVLDDGIHTPM